MRGRGRGGGLCEVRCGLVRTGDLVSSAYHDEEDEEVLWFDFMVSEVWNGIQFHLIS